MLVRPRPHPTAAPAASGELGRRPPLLAASYRAGARILRVVPAGFRHAVAAPGGTAWYWLSKSQRRAALDNYAVVLGRERSDPQVARLARRAFQNYGRMLTDFVLMGSLTPNDLIERTTIGGREHLDAALARGRGVIMAAPPVWRGDAAGSYAAAPGYPIFTLAPHSPASFHGAGWPTLKPSGPGVSTLVRTACVA